MFERFTDEARHVVVLAQDEARQLRHPHMGTEHLLLGLLQEEKGVAVEVLGGVGLTSAVVRTEISHLVRPPLGEADAEALAAIGIDLDVVRARVEEAFGVGALERDHRCRRGRREVGDARGTGNLPFTPRAKKVLELSLRQALNLRHRHIGTEHILLGLLAEGQGLALQVLTRRAIDPEELRRRVLLSLGAAA